MLVVSGSLRRAGLAVGLTLLVMHPLLMVLGLWSSYGLFYAIGVDWAMFWAGARAFFAHGPASVYDLGALRDAIQPLAGYYGPAAPGLKVNPVPYPPLFLLLVAPFTFPAPPLGFLLWTMVNLALSASAVRGMLCRYPSAPRRIGLATLLFLPVWWSLLVGQPMGLLLFAFYRAYRAFEEERDVSAGLWCGVLLLKPQYAAVLVLLLIFKRRWAAVLGVGLAGTALALSSLVILGLDGLVTFLRSVVGYADGFQATSYRMSPVEMVSWRGFLAAVAPELAEFSGLALTAVLSALTLGLLAWLWRGSWQPREPRFPLLMLAAVIATLLVGYDVHRQGGALLVVPALALAAQSDRPRWLRWSLCAGLFGPAAAAFA